MTIRIDFLAALALALIVLKLCDVIAWSWWIVLLPIWGPIAAYCFAFLVLCMIFVMWPSGR